MMIVGLFHQNPLIYSGISLSKELTVGCLIPYRRTEFERVMAMRLDGRVRDDPLHIRTVGTSELASAVEALASNGSTDVKVLLDPRAT